MPGMCSRLIGMVTIAVYLGLVAGDVRAAETDPDGRLYGSSSDSLADVRQALGRAEDRGRLALVVLGANWCHDSRALAARLQRSPLAELIEQHYELVFVDVGFYEHGRSVVQEFGVAHYYATPTVLIIDPPSGALINDADRHIWTNAYKIDMASSIQYFEKWALYAEIDRFEQQLAERVAAGYAVVGPLLEARVAGNGPEDFDARWDELAEFRTAIPGAISELRKEVQQRQADGETTIQLQFPEFPAFSWE